MHLMQTPRENKPKTYLERERKKQEESQEEIFQRLKQAVQQERKEHQRIIQIIQQRQRKTKHSKEEWQTILNLKRVEIVRIKPQQQEEENPE